MFVFSIDLRKGRKFFLYNVMCLVEFSKPRNFASQLREIEN